MTYRNKNEYKPTFFFKNKHFNTLYRFLLNKKSFSFVRERMNTSDGDFIDLDLASVHSDKLLIAVHGLEGSSQSSYIQSIALFGNKADYDVMSMNLRGCSGEPNALLSSYHSGKTEDLEEVIQYVIEKKKYKFIHLLGYSLGGNLVLKLMGEYAADYPEIIKSAIGISVPCDLEGSATVLNKGFNKLYQYGMLKTLLAKAQQKLVHFPESGIQLEALSKVSNFVEFDNFFTAPLHGFNSAKEYYSKSSCKSYIRHIKVPTLIIAALDDSFLSESCYPFLEVKENENCHLLTPKYGGHVGFYSGFRKKNNYWLEEQIVSFIKDNEPS